MECLRGPTPKARPSETKSCGRRSRQQRLPRLNGMSPRADAEGEALGDEKLRPAEPAAAVTTAQWNVSEGRRGRRGPRRRKAAAGGACTPGTTSPGQTAFERMPYGAPSAAKSSATAITPAFVTEYAAISCTARRPASEAMWIIEPPPCSRIGSKHARATLKSEVR